MATAFFGGRFQRPCLRPGEMPCAPAPWCVLIEMSCPALPPRPSSGRMVLVTAAPRPLHRHTTGITRREWLQVGYSGLLVIGLPSLVAGAAAWAEPNRNG